jgi:hypothetical protein
VTALLSDTYKQAMLLTAISLCHVETLNLRCGDGSVRDMFLVQTPAIKPRSFAKSHTFIHCVSIR